MSFTDSCELEFQQPWQPERIIETSVDHHRSRIESLKNIRSHDQWSYSNIDKEYYAKCLIGGGLSSSVRWALTPFDFIKCSMQSNPTRFPSFSAGLSLVWKEQGISGLYRGFAPTILAYFSQSGTKYAMYELIKDNLSRILGPDQAVQYQSLIYVVSAGSAEAIADVFMCPWEMIKVKVIGTVANFVTFEYTVDAIYGHLLTKNKEEYSKSTQLAVSFSAGYLSGLVSTIVSHPADSLLSLRARYADKSYRQIIDLVGWRQLATQGLIPRAALTGTIIASQWLLYDFFKTMLGIETSGGGSLVDGSKNIDGSAVLTTIQGIKSKIETAEG